MSSIGPEIPTHLLQQRRRAETDIDDDNEGPTAGPSTAIGPQIPRSVRATDADDIETYGPSAPSIGPQIPAHVFASKATSGPSAPADEEEEDDDAYVPALPPSLLAARTAGPAGPQKPPPAQTRRVIGPSFPGDDRARSYGDEDESDDDYGPGPMPPPPSAQRMDGLSEGVREFIEKEEKRRKEVEEASKPKQLKRDEWMLVPPSSDDILGRLSDPTKLKARQFSRTGHAARSQPNNLWTETPAERQQRIADEVAGRKKRAANAEDEVVDRQRGDGEGLMKRRRKDDEVRRVVEEHNKSARNKTLLEMHATTSTEKAKGKGKGGADDEPVAIWDHTRDMSLGGRLMDDKQRSKLIADAKGLSERFGSGKSGGYL